jgi:Bacterial conjugation TrbI-like protein
MTAKLLAATAVVSLSLAMAPVQAAEDREITVPAGTVLPLVLDSYVASDTSRLEDTVRAHVRRDVVIRNQVVIPAGSVVTGHVTGVQRSGRVKGRARVAFRFDRISIDDAGRLPIRTSAVARQAPATKAKDAATIGLPAAGGAIVGAITSGKKGAAIGAAAGGGAGTAVVLSTRGREVRLGPGAVVGVRLLEPIRLRVDDRP